MEVTKIRRQDRAVNDEAWIETFLWDAPVCTVAMVHDGLPFVNSNLFVYDVEGDIIYFHTAKEGLTRTIIELNPAICLTAFQMGRLLPAKEALHFSVEYASVVVFGHASVLEDEHEEIRALSLLLKKYAPHLQPSADYRPPIPAELKHTTTYQITIDRWLAKKKEVSADFPGAYWYDNVKQPFNPTD